MALIPVGRVLWDELLEEVILHITPLCSLLHILLKDGECVCRTSAILEYFYPLPLKRQSQLQQMTNFATSFPIFEKNKV